MQKIEGPFISHIPPVRLFLEDLKHLHAWLSAMGDLHYECKGYSYDSIEELVAGVGEKIISELKIEMSGISLDGEPSHLDLLLKSQEVIIGANHAVSEKAAALTEYLRAKSPWYSWHPVNASRSVIALWRLIGFTALLAYLINIALILIVAFPRAPYWKLLAVGALSNFLLGIALHSPSARLGKSCIFLYPLANDQTFWERHCANIITESIKAAVFGAIGFLLGSVLAR
jgi:hypothetical protein